MANIYCRILHWPQSRWLKITLQNLRSAEFDFFFGQKEFDWKMTANGVGKCRQVRIAYQMLALNFSTLHLNFEVFHLHLSILCCSLRSYMNQTTTGSYIL